MSRPQVGIERLPVRRMSNEPRESMNCKSCRKRKIKCNRLRPTCEACQVFQCPCVYDAVPKKRGPKTDVLEALLKRVDGLEKRLHEKKSSSPKTGDEGRSQDEERDKPPVIETIEEPETAVYSPVSVRESPPPPAVQLDVLLDTYFIRCHGRPYHIIEETSTRQRIQMNQVPSFLQNAIYAVAARYATHPNGYHAAVQLSEEYALRARSELDIDEPSIDCLQALLLLVIAFTAAGKGKKAYMLLANAIAMSMALSLHRESDYEKINFTPIERETRRRLFWTCYLLDRFSACGSKRPSLISDKCIVLRLPAWSPGLGVMPVEGEFFQSASNLQYGKKSQGSSGMLIDIARILGVTNRYLAAGGVKGDSHFPWHSLSNLSKIRNDLDVWASGTQDVFSSVDSLFGQPDSTTLVLSKLIYHLIHCLIYRPFLPIDLAELAGTGQHQSWQIEATNLCFLHANAIAELVELGKQSPSVEYPAFTGYCIFTASTVHVHGSHYQLPTPTSPFSTAADFLSREMQQLSELRYAWSSVQHQRDTLQTIYNCHSELVKSLASNPIRYSPVFHLEDFFDRYGDLGVCFDSANVSFEDITSDVQEQFTGHGLYAPREALGAGKRKRSETNQRRSKHLELKLQHQLSHSSENSLISPNPNTASSIQSADLHHQQQQQNHNHNNTNNNILAQTPPPSAFSALQLSLPFSPPYNLSLPGEPSDGTYDPMFGLHMSPSMGFNNLSHNNNHSSNNNNGFGNGNGNGSGQEGAGVTPGGESVGTHESEKDPFLSLLEQLAENEGREGGGGPSELDFFLAGGGAGG